jgi:hypothetical protein
MMRFSVGDCRESICNSHVEPTRKPRSRVSATTPTPTPDNEKSTPQYLTRTTQTWRSSLELQATSYVESRPSTSNSTRHAFTAEIRNKPPTPCRMCGLGRPLQYRTHLLRREARQGCRTPTSMPTRRRGGLSSERRLGWNVVVDAAFAPSGFG